MADTLKFLVVSRIMDNGILKGFTLVDISGRARFVDLSAIEHAHDKVEYLNARYDPIYKTLVGTCNSLSVYPTISLKYIILTNGVVVHYTLLDNKTKAPIGVVCYNALGMRYNCSYKKLASLCKKNPGANFKFVKHPQYGMYVVDSNGNEFSTIELSVKKQFTMYDSSKGEAEPEVVKSEQKEAKDVEDINSETSLSVPTVYSVDVISASDFNKDAQEKLMLAALNMKKLTPYYHCGFSAIKKRPVLEDDKCHTMQVSEDTMYYNMKFVATLSTAQLTFVLIHEICHLAMQHSIRRRNRIPYLWNIACDLYINTIICRDFKCRFGGGEVNYGTEASPVSISTPALGIFLETIDETLDLARDTPESIYEKLLKENLEQLSKSQNNNSSGSQPQNDQNSNDGDQSDEEDSISGDMSMGNDTEQDGLSDSGAQGDGQSNSGQSLQNGQSDEQNGNSNGLETDLFSDNRRGSGKLVIEAEGEDESDDGSNDRSMGSSADDFDASGQSSESETDKKKSKKGKKSGGKQGENTQNDSDEGEKGKKKSKKDKRSDENTQNNSDVGTGSDDSLAPRPITVTYNGKRLSGTLIQDIATNDNTNSRDTQQKNMDTSKDALQRIKTKKQMLEEKSGESLLKNAGAGAGVVQRYIDFGLATEVRWEVLLQNMAKVGHKRVFTLAQPNQDYMNMGMTIADRRKVGKPDRVAGIVIAVDVSGSVSKAELEKYLSEVNNIFTKQKVEGELIYWSTMVGDAGKFSSMKDLLKVSPVSSGGTDVRCVFDYLSGKTKVNGKYETLRGKDITGVFILTDGCFTDNYADYAKDFGRKTVWIIDGNPALFSPCFGKVVGYTRDR